MSPVNHDPSQDDAVATGRLPLTRRELRARERFLATQNQDLVPPSAYAIDDIEQQSPAGPAIHPLADGRSTPSASYPDHDYRDEAGWDEAGRDQFHRDEADRDVALTDEANTTRADRVEADLADADLVRSDSPTATSFAGDPTLLPEPETRPEPETLSEPETPTTIPALPTAAPVSSGTPVPAAPAVSQAPASEDPPTRAIDAVPEREAGRLDGHDAQAPEAPSFDDVLRLDNRQRDNAHDDGPHHHAAVHAVAAVLPHHEHADEGHAYYDAPHSDGVHPDDFHADAGHQEFHYAADAHDGYDHQDPDDNHVLIGSEAVPALPKPSKKVRRRRRLLALLVTLLVFVAVTAVGAQLLRPLLGMDKATDYPGPGTGVVKVTVQPGAGPRAVATTLERQKVVANADAFLKEFSAAGGELSPGDYEFRSEMKNSDAVAILLNRDSSKVMYFALNAGLRIGESLEAIAKGSGVPLEQLKALSDSPAQFGVPAKAKNLEGFLAPGEYRFPLGTPAKDILQKLVATTLEELKAQGITDPDKQYDTITVASIVQAEGGQADYGNVAGAIYNRLKPNNTETSGLIQSDATVTYGLGRKSFHIDEAEKADKANPYNTYANPGLPAGPIGSPGKSAIDAAAKPTANDYLYWVTINLDTKETKFSKTLAEHMRYVEQYNAWCGANPGRCV